MKIEHGVIIEATEQELRERWQKLYYLAYFYTEDEYVRACKRSGVKIIKEDKHG